MIPVEQARNTVREVHSRVAAACDKTHPRRHVNVCIVQVCPNSSSSDHWKRTVSEVKVYLVS